VAPEDAKGKPEGEEGERNDNWHGLLSLLLLLGGGLIG